MQVTGRQWGVALGAAVLVHAVVGGALFWQAPQSGAVSAGVGGIEVSLGPAGGAPGGEVSSVSEVDEAEAVTPAEVATEPTPETLVVAAPQAVSEPEAVPEVQPLSAPQTLASAEAFPAEVVPETQPLEAVGPQDSQETPSPVTIEDAVAIEAEDVAPAEDALAAISPQPAVETAAAAGPVPEATSTQPEEVVVASVVVPPPPSPKPLPPLQTSETSEPVTHVTQEILAPSATTEPTPTESALNQTLPAQTAPTRIAAVAPSAPGAGGKSGSDASPDAGSGSNATAGGRPGETVDYMATLQAWLEKHKEYPRRARLRRQEGTALLYFVMDRDGQVLEHRIERTSGYALLDREVAAMIERAQPLPRMPASMNRPRLELVVPVQFFLR